MADMRIANALTISLMMLLSGLAQAAGLQPYTATYELSRNGDQVGNVTFSLQRTPDGWSYDSQTTATSATARLVGIDVHEHSQTRSLNGALETVSYRYRQSSIAKSRSRSIDVDATNGRIVAVDKKREEQYPYQAGVLDRQAVTLAIAQDLAAGKSGTLNYNVADSHHVGIERYQVGKHETLQVPAGSMKTVVVARLRDTPDGRVTATWYGLDNGFVPVRVVQNEPKGDVYEMRLLSLKR